MPADAVPLVFRTATPTDATDVVALVESAYRGEQSRVGWTTEADLLDGQRTDVDAVRSMIGEPAVLVLLAERDGALLGCCELEHEGARGAYFGMFAVRPDLQAAGIGSAILAEAERVVAERFSAGVLRMLVVRQRPELISWYRRRGYEPTGETEPFPYGDEHFGIPRREDLEFVVLEKVLALAPHG